MLRGGWNEGSLSRASLRVRLPLRIQSSGLYVGGCQNYGPFLGPYYSTAPSI